VDELGVGAGVDQPRDLEAEQAAGAASAAESASGKETPW
jgi:hypothetical protein